VLIRSIIPSVSIHSPPFTFIKFRVDALSGYVYNLLWGLDNTEGGTRDQWDSRNTGIAIEWQNLSIGHCGVQLEDYSNGQSDYNVMGGNFEETNWYDVTRSGSTLSLDVYDDEEMTDLNGGGSFEIT